MQENISLKEIKEKSGQGVTWVGGVEVLIRGVQFGATVTLARLLMPEDFGLISIAFIFTQFSYVLFDFGLGSALIQKKDLSDSHFSTVFWSYLALAFVFASLVLVLAGPVAVYFRMPQVGNILKVLSAIFFLYALNAIPFIRLMKDIRFKQLTLAQLASVMVYAMVAIGMAFMGYGVWSFVFGSLSEQFILILLLYKITGWRPKFYFNREQIIELFRFGKNVLATRLLSYFNLNAPQFAIGKILGTGPLGYYSVAFQMVEIPVQRISKNVLKVMFPAFSKLQDQEQDYVHMYRRTVYYLAIIVFPVFAGLYVIAPAFIRAFYGGKWQAVVAPLQILTLVGLFRSLMMNNSLVFLSKGKPYVDSLLNLGYALLLVPFLFLVTPLGLLKVTVLLAVFTFVLFVSGQIVSARILGVSFGSLVILYRVPLLGILGFLALIKWLEPLYFHRLSSWLQMLVYIGIAVPVYMIVVILQDRQVFKKIKGLLHS